MLYEKFVKWSLITPKNEAKILTGVISLQRDLSAKISQQVQETIKRI
jgi:hypothetical protein